MVGSLAAWRAVAHGGISAIVGVRDEWGQRMDALVKGMDGS